MKSDSSFKTDLVAVLTAIALFVAGCFAQSQKQPAASAPIAKEFLETFLQNYVKTPYVPEDKTTRYFDAFVDLNDDGKEEVIVYLTGPQWCGSGGCTTLILVAEGSSYNVITKLTVAQRPIRVLAATSNGWHSLGVSVQGGGVRRRYEAILMFNGKTYPRNPTVPPAQRSTGKAEGKVVIPEELKELKSLYP